MEQNCRACLERNYVLPQDADSKALNQFLVAAKAEDPLRFPIFRLV